MAVFLYAQKHTQDLWRACTWRGLGHLQGAVCGQGTAAGKEPLTPACLRSRGRQRGGPSTRGVLAGRQTAQNVQASRQALRVACARRPDPGGVREGGQAGFQRTPQPGARRQMGQADPALGHWVTPSLPGLPAWGAPEAEWGRCSGSSSAGLAGTHLWGSKLPDLPWPSAEGGAGWSCASGAHGSKCPPGASSSRLRGEIKLP